MGNVVLAGPKKVCRVGTKKSERDLCTTAENLAKTEDEDAQAIFVPLHARDDDDPCDRTHPQEAYRAFALRTNQKPREGRVATTR